MAGEIEEFPVANLGAVIALAPPIDLARCSALISQRRNRLYELHFLRELVARARRCQRMFPDLPRVDLPRKLTLRIFDDLYTAPRAGYQGVDDYYTRASSAHLLSKIVTPTLIMLARDDPFVSAESFADVKVSPAVEVRILEKGGHLGFLGWDGAGGIRWAERRILEWVMAVSGRPQAPVGP